ncbi:hypothetical protein [Gluconacetobacter diazotrophicus]|uniref:Uncharacterized protein n=1 Tax=Gluconacetobacter diazotrophicus (strain ATCC 49037 / DSM 5601 / CCUG 37298 / CIP 103539 / LMG 7603 / PAl5) TaxID=272568 RepID=A9H6T7_GLUDA|nr:hypothetical protein [Gluconacetobacter diazotrophicus]CAP57545.1 hypothetical protein GDI3602 [Gluconacetobacter diazotrophicus PA1 5]
MTNQPYRTANAIPGIVADPAALAPDAVRCLWARPIDGRFLPSVIFRDGTDCPLACAMDELHARQFCQRISAIHDWPVMDHRPKDIGPEVAAEKIWATMPPEYKTRIDDQTCVNMEGIGFMMADMCREYRLPLGVAIHRITERVGSFIAAMVDQGAMTDEDGKENARRAAEGAFARLNEIYAGEGRGPDLATVTPDTLGVMLADYHQSKSSSDDQFQHGMIAALTIALTVWTGRGESEPVAKARADVTMDAAIRHWFRLKGKAVAG